MKKLLEDMIEKEKAKRLEKPEETPTAERATGGSGREYTTPEWAEYTGAFDPSQRLASSGGGNQGAYTELRLLRSKIERVEKSIQELKNMEETDMNSARLKARAKARRAYFLGGGGVNEPTPGKPKYEKEDEDTIRDKEDKQMVGTPLETGSEGLHPGDLEVKKKLHRAEKKEEIVKESLEERAMKRRAYWQGGGGISEPSTPGKPKYEKENADAIRDKEDKQMTGTPLDTGSDGLHPGDMEVKKKLLRAKLRARFTKVADDQGNINKQTSKWDVFAGDQLILTASGQEIYEDDLEQNWDYLQSKQYGLDVLRHIREEGFDRTAYLLKGAQDPLAGPAAAPAAPEAAPLPEVPAVPEAEPKVDVKKDETKEKAEKALNDVEQKLAELREVISGASGEELVDIDVNIEGKEGAKPEAEKAPALEGLLASKEDLLKVEALMDLSADELAEVSETLENIDKVAEDKRETVLKYANQALEDNATIMNQADELLAQTKPEVKDTKESKAQKLLDDALKVRAENRLALLAKAEVMPEPMMEPVAEPMYVDEPEMPAIDMNEDEMLALTPDEEDKLKKLLEVEGEGGQLAKDKEEKDDKKEDKEDEKEKEEKEEDKEDEKEKEEKEEDAVDGECVGCDDSTVLASRKAERDAIVVQAADKILRKYELDLGPAQNATEPTYFKAHPGGKGTVTELTGTKTPEALVESISEVHTKVREVAEAGPRNVREAATAIQESIVKGAFTAEDVDRLVAEGKVDATAASYWKQFFGQAPDSGSFGADMSKEFATKKKEADDKSFRLKLRRAYDVGMQAQDKGLVGATRNDLEKYVDEIMSFDDASFESTKRVVASYKATSSQKLPVVGGEEGLSQPIEVTANIEPASITDQLTGLGWK
jgi:hypothetical protein